MKPRAIAEISSCYLCLTFSLAHMANSADVFRDNPYARQFADENNFAPGFIADLTGPDVVIQTNNGYLRGKRRPGIQEAAGSQDSATWFLGVPYAQPPVGPLRFKAPKPLTSWNGIRNATMFGAACPQNGDLNYVDADLQDEDCLYLNVYTPFDATQPGDEPYPVMMYIHGGSYAVGSGSMYFGHLLAQYGVVVVTINYRLGILGFACSSFEGMSGNYGLMDQIEALSWIKRNIGAFGGDPGRVTVFGNSAGGSSVSLLSVTPLARGLFRAAIGQSGSSLAFWATHNRSVDLDSHMMRVGGMLGCDGTTLKEMHQCMMELPWRKFASLIRSTIPRISPSATDLKPCIDGYVIPDLPHDYLADGNINIQAFLTGVVKDEWSRHIPYMIHDMYYSKPNLDRTFVDGFDRHTFEAAVDHVIKVRFGWSGVISDLVKHEYTNWKSVTDPLENRRLYCQLMTDLAMVAPTVEISTLMHARGVSVYMYSFEHEASERDWQSSYHQIELQYVFGAPFLGIDVFLGTPYGFSDEDRNVSKTMLQLWSSFARHGRPVTPTSSGAEWWPFQPLTTDYLSIHDVDSTTGREGPHLRMKQYYRAEKVSFWNQLVRNMRAQMTQPPLVSRAEGCVVGNPTSLWILVGLCVILSLTLTVAVICVSRLHTRYRRLSTSGDGRSASVRS